MNERERFEQWLSEWLDESANLDLRARIDAAIEQDSELRVEFERWMRLNSLLRRDAISARVRWELLRDQTREVVSTSLTARDGVDDGLERLLHSDAVAQRVDWRQLQTRIGSAIAAAENEAIPAADDALVAALRGTADIDARVRWGDLKARIGASLPAGPARGRKQNRRTWMRVAASLGIAAAAALGVLWWRGLAPGGSVPTPSRPSFANVEIVAAQATPARPAAESYARVTIVSTAVSEPPSDEETDLFLMIDAPPRMSRDAKTDATVAAS